MSQSGFHVRLWILFPFKTSISGFKIQSYRFCQKTLWRVSKNMEQNYTLENKESHLKTDPWKRRFLLETMIFRIYVSLRECKNIANDMTWILDVNLAILKDRVLLNLLKFRGTKLFAWKMTQATNTRNPNWMPLRILDHSNHTTTTNADLQFPPSCWFHKYFFSPRKLIGEDYIPILTHIFFRWDWQPPTSTVLTPPKTNMEPETEPLEEEIPMKNHHF